MNILKLLAVGFVLILAGCSKPDKPSIALNLAVERGDINQIERHFHWNSDINKLNSQGEAPLHIASSQGSYIIVKMLIERGANIEIRDKNDHSALERAVLNGHTQIAEYLATQGALHDVNQLMNMAVKAGVTDRDIIPLLIELGAQINQQNSEGQTPLTQAINSSNRVLVKLLIQSDADVNLANKANERPLAIAQQRGDQDIIRLLQRNGAQ